MASFLVKDWGSCTDPPNDPNGVATLACIPVVIVNVINFLMVFSGIVAIFLVALSGYKFITSRGDPERLDSARKTFYYAVIGLLFIFLSFFLISLIGKITGVEQIPH